MQDLQGPRLRTGRLERPEGVELQDGHEIAISSGDFKGNAEKLSTDYNYMADDVGPGDRILIGDGLIVLEVQDVRDGVVHCMVESGGILRENQGINLPGVSLSISPPTEKDLEDIRFGCTLDVDFVALSFVTSASEINQLREILQSEKFEWGRTPSIIAKIERPEAVDNLREILDVSDGVMVARGDLGIEMPIEKVPRVQKLIIREANKAAVPVITATQMLESMMREPSPTRAEASDVANAILDGTDAVMLSGETAVGRYPLEAAAVMDSIAREAELMFDEQACCKPADGGPGRKSNGWALARAACQVADDIEADGILAFTLTGTTARFISCQRPAVPVYALTPEKRTYRQLSLVWGINPVMMPVFETTDDMIEMGERKLLQLGYAGEGDVMVCVAGASTNTPGGNDMLKIHSFGSNFEEPETWM
jgi:pyruvate kinase